MIGLIPMSVVAVLACGVLLTLASDTFAVWVSRPVESAFDAVEYRLALRERRREEKRRDLAGVQTLSYGRGGRSIGAAQLASAGSDG